MGNLFSFQIVFTIFSFSARLLLSQSSLQSDDWRSWRTSNPCVDFFYNLTDWTWPQHRKIKVWNGIPCFYFCHSFAQHYILQQYDWPVHPSVTNIKIWLWPLTYKVYLFLKSWKLGSPKVVNLVYINKNKHLKSGKITFEKYFPNIIESLHTKWNTDNWLCC